MSATLFVGFRDDGFWAYDIIVGVFLKHLIDAAMPELDRPGREWLANAVNQWRIIAVGRFDYCLDFDDQWTNSQIESVTQLAVRACDQLRIRDTIPTNEIESWRLFEDCVIWHRGLSFVTTASAIRLGEAMIQLINGILPEPPEDTWWFFSTDPEPDTVGRGKS